jgi:predicted RNase H-like nuclease (RuvC/YqgF family)
MIEIELENESLRGSCKAMGADIRKLTRERNKLKREVEQLRKALTTIREESHDIGACECAADALIDSRK